MSAPKYAKKTDGNLSEIISALRKLGASVDVLDPNHRAGLPDLLVGFRGRNILLEVKNRAGPKGGVSHRTISETQKKWHSTWNGEKPIVVRDIAEASQALVGSIIIRRPAVQAPRLQREEGKL